MLSCRHPGTRCWMKVFSLSSIFLVNSPGPTGGQSCFDLLKRFSTKGPKTHDPTPAFAFDIDGVLKRGSEVIPQAQEAIATAARARQPFVFLTNGGGDTEASRAKYLSSMLQLPISAPQVIMAHTPMQELLPQFSHEAVLICGRGQSLLAAKNYGFKRALSPLQLAAALGPEAVPFSQVPSTEDLAKQTGHLCPVQEFGAATADAPIRAILVFTDPDDWSRDLQMCFDVIQHNGVLLGSRVNSTVSQVDVFFGQDDLLWANAFPAPRFGLGAFRRALSHLYEEATRCPLTISAMYGKPTLKPYRLAKNVLDMQAQKEGASHAEPIYMVGDNPEVDVRGANNAGKPWRSVLVRTGVFSGSGNYETCPADIVVDHVADAVEAAQHRERFSRWHALR